MSTDAIEIDPDHNEFRKVADEKIAAELEEESPWHKGISRPDSHEVPLQEMAKLLKALEKGSAK